MQIFRRIFVAVSLLACAATVVLAVVSVGLFVFAILNPFSGFAGTEDFVDLSGPAARSRMGDAWPKGIDAASVASFTHKTNWSRDSFSSWYRIQLTKQSAATWADHLHAAELRLGRLWNNETAEGVHRTIIGHRPRIPRPAKHRVGGGHRRSNSARLRSCCGTPTTIPASAARPILASKI